MVTLASLSGSGAWLGWDPATVTTGEGAGFLGIHYFYNYSTYVPAYIPSTAFEWVSAMDTPSVMAFSVTGSEVPVPEPATFAVAGAGLLLGILAFGRRQHQRRSRR